MNKDNKTNKDGSEQYFLLSITEVTRSFGVKQQTIEEIVEEGIISVNSKESSQWEFDHEAIRRIRMVLQLQRDLGVNTAGAGLALDLMKEIERLHRLLNH